MVDEVKPHSITALGLLIIFFSGKVMLESQDIFLKHIPFFCYIYIYFFHCTDLENIRKYKENKKYL